MRSMEIGNMFLPVLDEPRFSTVYNLTSSLRKEFEILANVSTKAFDVSFKWEEKEHNQTYTPPDQVTVSENLYRQYNCLDYGCSRCCWKTRHWNIFSPEQYRQLAYDAPSHTGFGQELNLTINGKRHPFYVENNTQEICRHLKDNKCGIHESNPIHCALPLIKFKRTRRSNSEITYITREVYTRNWHMQCPVNFKPINEDGFRKTLWVLERTNTLAQELGISTVLPEIMNTVRGRMATALQAQEK